jgi:hypothetical protein
VPGTSRESSPSHEHKRGNYLRWRHEGGQGAGGEAGARSLTAVATPPRSTEMRRAIVLGNLLAGSASRSQSTSDDHVLGIVVQRPDSSRRSLLASS